MDFSQRLGRSLQPVLDSREYGEQFHNTCHYATYKLLQWECAAEIHVGDPTTR